MFRAPQWIVTYFFQIMSYKKCSLKDQLTLEMIIINQIMLLYYIILYSITTSKSKCSSVNSTLGEFLLLCKQHKLSSLIDKVNVLLTFSAGSENDNSSTAHGAVWGGTKAFLLHLWVSFISPTCGGVSLPVRWKWRKSIPVCEASQCRHWKLQRCFRPGQRSSKSGLGSSRGPRVSPAGSTTKSDCPDFSTIKKNHFNCAYDTIFLFTVVFTFCRLNTKF